MAISVECTCGKRFNVKDEWAGQTVQCQICQNSIIVPLPEEEHSLPPIAEAPTVQPSPSPQKFGEDSMLCDFCAEPIPAQSAICPLCGESLQDSLPQHQVISMVQANVEELDQYTSMFENLENDEKMAGSTIGVTTIVVGLISLLSIIMIAGGIMMKKDGELLIVFGIILLIGFGIGFLVALANDLKSRISDNETALKAFKSFVCAITTNRFSKAYARLSPAARNLSRTTYPEVAKITISMDQPSITNPKQMKKYWKGLIKPSGSYNRTCSLKSFKILSGGGIEDKYAIAEVDMKITTYPSILIALILLNLLICLIVILIVQKTETLKFRKLMIKSNGKWYFTSGDFGGIMDRLESVDNIG